MASTLGLGGSASATTTEATVYDSLVDAGSCFIYEIRNNEPTDGSGNTLLVRYAIANGAAHWVPLPPGGVRYIVDKVGMRIIYAKAAANTVAYSGGPVGTG